MNIRKGYFGSIEKSFDGKHVRKGLFGPVEYTFDGKHFRKGMFGPIAYTVDGKHLRKGMFGPVEYTLDGNHIRKGYFGSVVGTIDGRSSTAIPFNTNKFYTSSYYKNRSITHRSTYRPATYGNINKERTIERTVSYEQKEIDVNREARALASKFAFWFGVCFLLIALSLGSNEDKQKATNQTVRTTTEQSKPATTNSVSNKSVKTGYKMIVQENTNQTTVTSQSQPKVCYKSACGERRKSGSIFCEKHYKEAHSKTQTQTQTTYTTRTQTYKKSYDREPSLDEAYEEEADTIYLSDPDLYYDMDDVYDDFDWLD